MATQWVDNPYEEGGGHWVDVGQQSIESMLAKYGLKQGASLGGVGLFLPSGSGSPDLAGAQNDPEFQKLLSSNKYRIATPQDIARINDPNDPENNQGGSDLANIAGVLGFVGGGAALTGGLGGLLGGGGSASGLGSAADEIAALTGSGAGAGGFSTLSVAGAAGLGNLATTDLGGGYSSIGAVGDSGAGSVLTPAQVAANVAQSGAGGNEIAGAGLGASDIGAGAGVAGAAASGTGGASTTAAAGTAISRILNGTATSSDWLSVLGQAAPGLIGAYTSSNATDQYKALADQFASYGAPYRQRLSDLYANPDSFLSSKEVTTPVQQGSDIMARSLSTQGNPVGSGNALQQLQSYSADQLFGKLGQEKDRLAGFGGLSNYNAAAPSAAAATIGSSNNTANALGAAANNVFNPPQTLAQQLTAFKTLMG